MRDALFPPAQLADIPAGLTAADIMGIIAIIGVLVVAFMAR